MKSLIAISLIASLSLVPVTGGTIRGTVRAEGRIDAANAAAGGKYDSRKYKFAEQVNYAELRDFVVCIDGPVAGTTNGPDQTVRVETKRVNQKAATFSPHVLPVVAGTTVEWPNNDDIFHNVFSMSETKPFDLGLYKGPEVKRVTFDKAGRVDVFCSIHANMNCIVLVVENPFFSVTDEAGRYVITNVPAGTYKLKAWHERLPSQVQEITVPEQGEVKMNFTLGIKNLPKY
jgi:plastocyanin